MDFDLTDEQQMIAASATDWLQNHYDFRQREASLFRDGGSTAVWRSMAELGWLALPLPADVDGLELGLMDCCVLARALGASLVVEPYIDCVLDAAGLLALAGSSMQRLAWLPGVAAGAHRLALVHAEAGRSAWNTPSTTARRAGADWVLDGAKQCALSAAGAARWIVSAQVRDDAANGIALFLVDPAAEGLVIDAYDTSDGGRAADIRFEQVRLDATSRLDDADATSSLRRVLAMSTVARCWMAGGTMAAMLDQTAQYVQQRRQFGQALADFQVVQHRLAEMKVLCTETQAACELACLTLGRFSVDDDQTIASLAKDKVARAARYVSQQCVQLHGAMGVCEELPIASGFRALLAFIRWDGDAADHALQAGRALLAGGSFGSSRTLPRGQVGTVDVLEATA